MIFPALLPTNPSSSPRLSLLTQLMSQNLNPDACYLSSTNSKSIQNTRCIPVVPTTKRRKKKYQQPDL